MSIIEASEFDGDFLNIHPIKSNLNENEKTAIIPWHQDTSFDLLSNSPKNNKIKLYSNMKRAKYLSKEYFDKYQNILSNAMIHYGKSCAEIINTNYQYITIKYLNDDQYHMKDRLKSVLNTCDVYALPVIRTSSYVLGNMSSSETYKFSYNNVEHIVLCLGKINNKYLII